MDLDTMEKKLEKSLQPKRFHHCTAVRDTAIILAKRYGADVEKAAIAGLIHDCARKIPTKDFIEVCTKLGIPMDDVERHQPILLHAKLGVHFAKEDFGVTDPEILDAIRYHTTGKAHMSLLDKVIYLADLLEPHRDFATVDDMRKQAEKSLDGTLLSAYENTMNYLLGQDLLIHPDCLAGYNELVMQRLDKKKE
ncbi:MAG: bis(5'-nucleosyl)-tetraphosphatase (symmetrical) YqeK [Acidaminococcus sp.]|jgi:predicted HD superfamily hydrolase involved in NAD metabolism|nr:bis(5'-nucleosyl)-tetraphosphatase (symmetrical) YqeK [Acidaminococcus sp.]MCI2100452.1 bis(5'-nucleosyl)-tetraphosphatase (symmetrical) YqeK [Acidaminococcus sp.]MCI2114773.1 bis(5'-nucleosyl)-tetraphosphatase (symmetrical) YqeK [Acidaminococcus sp.]MCI2116807.1 bis(5'-nucleosyl)-tetraphosphatase (symmetrical) YqeK [Acidaminococcus sp.]